MIVSFIISIKIKQKIDMWYKCNQTTFLTFVIFSFPVHYMI